MFDRCLVKYDLPKNNAIQNILRCYVVQLKQLFPNISLTNLSER